MMKNPVHPGEILREDVLAEIGLSVSEAATMVDSRRQDAPPNPRPQASLAADPSIACGGRYRGTSS